MAKGNLPSTNDANHLSEDTLFHSKQVYSESNSSVPLCSACGSQSSSPQESLRSTSFDGHSHSTGVSIRGSLLSVGRFCSYDLLNVRMASLFPSEWLPILTRLIALGWHATTHMHVKLTVSQVSQLSGRLCTATLLIKTNQPEHVVVGNSLDAQYDAVQRSW